MGSQISKIILELDQPVTAEEARAGWTERSKHAILEFFKKLEADLSNARPILYVGIARSLDTWGVDGGSLYDEIIDVAAALNAGKVS